MIVKTSRVSTTTNTIVPSSNSRFQRLVTIVLKSVRWENVEFGYFSPQAATTSAIATGNRAQASRRGLLRCITGFLSLLGEANTGRNRRVRETTTQVSGEIRREKLFGCTGPGNREPW